MPLLQLSSTLIGHPSDSIDIVAVHGLEGNLTEAWTDIETRVLWLRDLLPHDLPNVRVLTFGYTAHASAFYGKGSADRIQQHAQTLVADLQADRSLEGCPKRPIIFLCHGLGGILVKKALAYSSTRTSLHVEHLYSIFVSTYAVLFFGTPHLGVDTNAWLTATRSRSPLSRIKHREESPMLMAVGKDCETLQSITEQFTHLMRQFHIFFFWEDLETVTSGQRSYVVEESSAAPILDHTERVGIHANHAQMIQFASRRTSSYRTIVEALKRYCNAAPSIIAGRWNHAIASLSSSRANEAAELASVAFDIHNENRPYQFQRMVSEKPKNKFFRIPQAVSSIFTGREDVAAEVQGAFWSCMGEMQSSQQRRFWGVFWIDATTSETAKHSFSMIGKLGGMEATESAGKHWLSSAEEPWLLIINNADDPTLDLTNLFPEGERGFVLVTTRNPHLRTHGSTGSKEFKGLDENDAIHLLLRAADTPRPWDQTVEKLGLKIADTLGYLALALIQAGALILQRMCNMGNYLDYYNEYRQRVGGRRMSLEMKTEDQSAVYATWEHSLDSLCARGTEAGSDAIELLSIVAFYHFEHIRVDIFSRAFMNTISRHAIDSGRSFGGRLWSTLRSRLEPPPVLPSFLRQAPQGTDSFRVRRALHELSSFSLITYDGKDDSFSLHPVVHAWARDRLNKHDQALWGRMAVNVLSESILLPPQDAGETHEAYRRDILIHLDLCLRTNPAEILNFESAFGTFRLPLAFTFHYAWLFTFRDQVLRAAKFGYVYLERGRLDEGATLLGNVKDALIASRGYKDDKTMIAMLALAEAYWLLGRLEEAINLQRTVSECRLTTLGANHKDTLSVMDRLGRSYWLNGQYKQALDLQTRTVKQMKAQLGHKHELTLTAMDNLGVSCGSWRRYTESMKIHRQVLQARKELLGPTHLDTIFAMNNLAMALKDLGDLDEAQTLMVEAYEQRKRKLGREHPWTLWALCNLAKVKTEPGLLQEAEDMLIPGIAAGKRSLGDTHLGVLIGMAELSRVYVRQKRLSEASKLLSETVNRFEQHRGPSHPDTLLAMHLLGRVYQMQGRTDDATHICRKADTHSCERLTDEHPLVQDIRAQVQGLSADVPETNIPPLSQPVRKLNSQGSPNTAKPPSTDVKRRIEALKARKTM